MDGSFRTRPRLSVVLPARNEEESIEAVVSTVLERCVGRLSDLEILVVDDGSRDRTAARVHALASREPAVRLLRHEAGRGYGAALRTGFSASRFEWVFYTDADGQFPLAELPGILDSLGSERVVVGYRASRADAPTRRLLGRAWSGLVRRALGVSARDVNCAFKLFPRRLLDGAELSSDGAAISAELLRVFERASVPVHEVAVEHRPRAAGTPTGARPAVVLRAITELASLARG